MNKSIFWRIINWFSVFSVAILLLVWLDYLLFILGIDELQALNVISIPIGGWLMMPLLLTTNNFLLSATIGIFFYLGLFFFSKRKLSSRV